MKNTSIPQKVQVSEKVLFQEIEGEGVLLNLTNEQYFGLNEIGTRIWHLLSADDETDKALQSLLKEYDVEETVLKNDFLVLIDELEKQGMVSISN